ncbi:AmmeMemoRadiSam system protein A [Methanobrevibacter curvatus]|uniref:Protein MBCUR_12920 n=1 Tax=Methanobrevibacter curvatus TaxID=49547 RepID=A0A166C6M8_9EURY|nr:AmmeMemoRadiSam system protein A [Methanobrevibacter curvatus]KZX11707.1 hypothetical protein MBCUR_12920 [Methanobrevibacter curvatus]
MISENQGKYLIGIARKSIIEYLEFRKITSIPPEVSEELLENLGVFVTLNKNNQLRGCIGYIEASNPLIELTIQSAIMAATNDSRFENVTIEELDEIDIEITILTRPKLIKVLESNEYLDKIKIGVDGLIVEKGFNKGVLLPQVPVENNWDVREFLEYTCLKAGLPTSAWLGLDTLIYSFQGQIIKE